MENNAPSADEGQEATVTEFATRSRAGCPYGLCANAANDAAKARAEVHLAENWRDLQLRHEKELRKMQRSVQCATLASHAP